MDVRRSEGKVGRRVKAKGSSPARQASKSATKAKAPAKAGTMAKPGASKATPTRAARGKKVVLLSGGNPQIAKGEGNGPVQAYIAALPGWKSEHAKRLDALIVQAVPNVRKAVKWNSPLYGIEGRGWFLGVHAFARYLKVSFFRGTRLKPEPPGPSKDADTRYLDIHEGDELDEARLASWVKQAAALPGGRGLGS